MVETLKRYVSMFGEEDEVTSAGFKKDMRLSLELDQLEHHSLNIYWSRCTCGVTSKSLGKDIFHVSYNGAYGGSWASDSYKLATSVKVCELFAAYLSMTVFVCFCFLKIYNWDYVKNLWGVHDGLWSFDIPFLHNK